MSGEYLEKDEFDKQGSSAAVHTSEHDTELYIDPNAPPETKLKRSLKNRHIAMIR